MPGWREFNQKLLILKDPLVIMPLEKLSLQAIIQKEVAQRQKALLAKHLFLEVCVVLSNS